MTHPKIKKAIFPVAGPGTRFLPVTKASPKEMLPIVDKPLIQYAVDEAVKAGITDLIFITGRHKRSIEDHFDDAFELEHVLQAQHKHDLLALIQNIIPKHVNCIYIRQPRSLGLGHAVLCAKPALEHDEPFAVILADELIENGNAISQMIDAYNTNQCSILGVQAVDNVSSYGIVKTSTNNRVIQIIEKPQPQNAPSNLAVIGRYILTPKIMELIELVSQNPQQEIQLTDAISSLIQHEKVVACHIDDNRFDCGSKLGYIKATINFALKHPELSTEIKQFIKGICYE
jgi:UTP--glucose-1-phosphate uridylyltransferase